MTLTVTHADASANILRYADEGRLIQSKWRDRTSDDREVACLLASVHPSLTSARDCPVTLVPAWLAELTVVLFDGIPPPKLYPSRGATEPSWHGGTSSLRPRGTAS